MYRVGDAAKRCRAAPPQVGCVAPGRKCTSRASLLPVTCWVLVIAIAVLSYHPRAAKALSSNDSWNNRVPWAGAIATELALVGPLIGWSPTVHAKISATGSSARALFINARRAESLCLNVMVRSSFRVRRACPVVARRERGAPTTRHNCLQLVRGSRVAAVVSRPDP